MELGREAQAGWTLNPHPLEGPRVSLVLICASAPQTLSPHWVAAWCRVAQKIEQRICAGCWGTDGLCKTAPRFGDFPGGPAVKTPPSNADNTGLIPGQGTKISHATGQLSPCTPARESLCTATKTQCCQKKKEESTKVYKSFPLKSRDVP